MIWPEEKVIGNAAQHPLPQPAVAVGPRNDKVGAFLVGHLSQANTVLASRSDRFYRGGGPLTWSATAHGGRATMNLTAWSMRNEGSRK